MRKLILLLLLVTACSQLTFAQSNTIQIEDSSASNPTSWRDTCFGLLDRSAAQIPSGYLLDYSMASFYDSGFNGRGIHDTIGESGLFWAIHNIFSKSIVNGNAGLPGSTDSLLIDAYRYQRNSGSVPLLFLLQGYQKIRTTALNQGLFNITSDSLRLADVAGRPSSPYDNLTCFAFCPLQTIFKQFGSITFSLPAEFWLMNGITSVSVDFGDGAGPRALSPGATVSVTYQTVGLKYLTAVVSSAAGTFTAFASVQYSRPAVYAQPDTVWNVSVAPLYTSIDQYLSSQELFVAPGGGRRRSSPRQYGGPSGCQIESIFDQINCDINPGATVKIINGCDRLFDKPIIVVEGFDPDGSITTETLYENFTQYYGQFSGQTFSSFVSMMRAAGYDFVFVTFTKPTDFIENNAMVLEQVIQRVNAAKTGTNKSTVIGWSMGGLVSRWALKDMEDNGIDHQVANYFSYDAPHQGANVPLGLQFIFSEMQIDLPYLVYVKKFKQLAQANASPAAREMLVTRGQMVGNAPALFTLDPVRAKFAQALMDKGYPQQVNRYGISFGRGNNTPGARDAGNGAQFGNFGPGSNIFDGTLPFALVNVFADAYAVPENRTDYIARYRYVGLKVISLFGFHALPVGFSVKSINFKYSGVYPYDDAPGGYENTQDQFAESFNDAYHQILGDFVGFLGLPPVIATTNGHYGHDFIPVPSALDLQNQNYSSSNAFQSSNLFYNIDNSIVNAGQLGGNTLSSPTLSPFQAVLTSTSDCPAPATQCEMYDNDVNGNPAFKYANWNQSHVGAASNQTAEFMTREILGSIPNYQCPNLGFCDISGSILGPALLCSSGQYQFSAPYLNGFTLQWTSQNGFLTITSGQGTPSITVTRSGTMPGNDVLLFTITNSCGQQINYSLPVVVGAPTPQSSQLLFNTAGVTNEILQPCNPLRTNIFQGQYVGWVDISDPVATSYNWTLISKSPNVAASLYFNPNGQHVEVSLKGPVGSSSWYNVSISNGCGRTVTSYQFIENANCLIEMATRPSVQNGMDSSYTDPASGDISITPNPARSSFTVVLQRSDASSMIYGVKVLTSQGNLVRAKEYQTGVGSAAIQVADLSAGLYIVSVFDGTRWESRKLLIEK